MRVKILPLLLLCMILTLSVAAPGWGMPTSTHVNMQHEDLDFFVGLSTEIESGEMRYVIQGAQDGGWKSELIWPLEEIVYGGGVLSLRFWNKFQVNAGIWKSLTKDAEAGTMKDSDWFYRKYGDRKAIYSETETMVDGIHVDLNIHYDFLKRNNLSIGPLVGYMYTKWDWSAGRGYQTTIDPSAYYIGVLPEDSITYEQTIQALYLGAAFSGSLYDTVGFNIYTLYTPFAICDDIDVHLLRYKESSGQTDGSFLSVGGDLSWKFAPFWTITARFNHTAFDFEGEQEQYFYGGSNPSPGTRYGGIDLTIEGQQSYIGVMLGYEF